MKIAILGIKTLPAFAGADRVVESLLENLPHENKYDIYLLKNEAEQLSCTDRMHYIYVPAIGGKHLRPFIFFLLCTFHFLFKGNADIVHVHNSDFGLFVPILKLKRKAKIVGTFHGNPYERGKWNALAKLYFKFSELLFFHFCDALTSVSKRESKRKKGVKYIPNGVDFFSEGTLSGRFDFSKFNLELNNYFLFACGRLDSTKGLHHLLDAYLNGGFAEKLLVIGDFSHDLKYVKQIRETASKSDRIIIHDRLLSKGDLIEVLKHCRVFVFPSEVEAMSMMLLEAISCKKVVICSDIEQNVEVVGRDYKYLFSIVKKNDLLQKMRMALQDEKQEEMMERLFERCAAKYKWSSIAEEYTQVFEGVMLSAT
jgi:glycosyltransferase involved in cell wall biosynthesis